MQIFARGKKIGFSLKLWLILLPLVVIPLTCLDTFDPGFFQYLDGIIAHHRLVFTCFRWFFIGITVIGWPHIVQYWGRQKYWLPEKITFWRKKRFIIGLWLLLFELFINENIASTLLHLWSGA